MIIIKISFAYDEIKTCHPCPNNSGSTSPVTTRTRRRTTSQQEQQAILVLVQQHVIHNPTQNRCRGDRRHLFYQTVDNYLGYTYYHKIIYKQSCCHVIVVVITTATTARTL